MTEVCQVSVSLFFDWTLRHLVSLSDCVTSYFCLCHSRDHQCHGSSQDSVLVQSMELPSQQDTWHSLSCLTDSTEQSAPINFIMSNRVRDVHCVYLIWSIGELYRVFHMFFIITNIYNRKIKGSTFMELFTAPRKLKKFFFFWQLEMFDVCTTGDMAHIDTIFKYLPHTRQHGCFLLAQTPSFSKLFIPHTNGLVCRRVLCVLC